MGLDFLKNSVPDISSSPQVFEFLKDYTDRGYASILIFLAVGTVLTIVIQSSSATMALTLVMCSQGWIPYEMAVAMVLGENIGTTVTANIAAAVGNISARRAAMVHLVFNLMGVIWLLIFFYPFVGMISRLVVHYGGHSPYEDVTSVPFALAAFHTVFNLTNSFVFIWFTKVIEKLVMIILPAHESEDEEFHLRFITTGMLSTAELSLIQAKKEIQFYAKHTKKMFGFVRKLMSEDSDSKFTKLYAKIERYERISDNVEVEIANYLTKVNHGKLSDSGRRSARAMLKLIGEIESIDDSNFTLARIVNRMRESKVQFDTPSLEKIFLMFNMVDEALAVMRENLETDGYVDLSKAREYETQINRYRDQLKLERFEDIRNGKYTYEEGVFFTDMVQECERMGDYIINVAEALSESE